MIVNAISIPGIALETVVPHQWQLPLGSSDQVVGEEELYGLGDAVPAELLGDSVDGFIVRVCI